MSKIAKAAVVNTYNFYASFYDLLFGWVLDQGRKRAVRLMTFNKKEKILEIGIGTGLSVPHYPKNLSISLTGIDLSQKMLDKAYKRANRVKGISVELLEMNGETTNFSDNQFDKVVMMYVYSVTPNPEVLLKEASRVCKPNGDIFIVNHFSQSKSEKLSFLERLVSGISENIGFRSNFSFNTYVLDSGFEIKSIRNANIFSLTKVIQLQNIKETPAPKIHNEEAHLC